jgi:hypothetical protein
MSRLAAAAHEKLGMSGAAAPLERLWLRAALETVASGELIEPPLAELKRLTEPAHAWQQVAPWPAEALQDRIGRLIDSHRLAIALTDMDWLDQLDAAWESAPAVVDHVPRLRARGEIGLGLSPGGRRPHGWSPAELGLLTEESFLLPNAPSDRAWRALAEHHPRRARRELADFDARMTLAARSWEATPENGLRQLRAHPSAVLRVESRALRALIARSLLT